MNKPVAPSDLSYVTSYIERLLKLSDQCGDVVQKVVMHPAELERLESSVPVIEKKAEFVPKQAKIYGVPVEVNDRLPEHVVMIKMRNSIYSLNLRDGRVSEMLDETEGTPWL